MDLIELLNKIKDNVADFIERYDDFFFDINPCTICHEDLYICPNPRCRVAEIICEICNDNLSICENCDKEIFIKYQEYFMLVNGIAANPQKFTSDEVVVMLEEAIKKVKGN
jgi:hypothetical protein